MVAGPQPSQKCIFSVVLFMFFLWHSINLTEPHFCTVFSHSRPGMCAPLLSRDSITAYANKSMLGNLASGVVCSGLGSCACDRHTAGLNPRVANVISKLGSWARPLTPPKFFQRLPNPAFSSVTLNKRMWWINKAQGREHSRWCYQFHLSYD